MCFFWITALIDIFMKIIITREYIMKRKVLAMLVPALLVAGAANAAEIYNKNGNKVELYGKMVGERILTDRENGEKGDNSQDTSYARVGVKGETQINPCLLYTSRYREPGEKSSATAAFFNPGGRRDASPAP